jgi:hypothetical protein
MCCCALLWPSQGWRAAFNQVQAATKIVGVDFSSSPSQRKPIVVAHTLLHAPESDVQPWVLSLEGFENLYSLEAFSEWLCKTRPWVGGFDFPFALPKELLKALEWPPFSGGKAAGSNPWCAHIEHLATLSRAQMVAAFKAFCASRPAGGKFAHRASDGPAGASPSMKWVNPPVAYMLHAGATRLHHADVTIPGLRSGDPKRVALEAYPGYLARIVLGRESYKSDDRSKQNEAKCIARERLVDKVLAMPLSAVGMRSALGLNLTLTARADLKKLCVSDASGDHLDAWLCAIQACVGYLQEQRLPGCNYAMGEIDSIEGWIVGVVRD